MNILLGLFLMGITVIGMFAALIGVLKNGLKYALKGSILNSNLVLTAGEKTKAKVLEKAPLVNPFVKNDINNNTTNNNNNNNNNKNEMVINRIPDMRGVDNGNAALLGGPVGSPMEQATAYALGGPVRKPNASLLRGSAGNNTNTSLLGGPVRRTNVPAVGAKTNGVGPRMAGVGGASNGIAATAIIGMNNAIGGMIQNGNVMNKFAAHRQVSGPIFQSGGMVYNISPKGSRTITQMANAIANSSNRGRLTLNQGGNAQNAINRGRQTFRQGQGAQTAVLQGKVSIKNTGKNANTYVNGNVRGIKSRLSGIRTEALQIKGVSKIDSLLVKRLFAPKARRIHVQEMMSAARYPEYALPAFAGSNVVNNQYTQVYQIAQPKKRKLKGMPAASVAQAMPASHFMPDTQAIPAAQAMPAGNNINVNLNDISLQRQNDYKLKKEHYSVNQNSISTMLEMKNVMKDPRNNGLTMGQRNKMYSLTKAHEENIVAGELPSPQQQQKNDRTEAFYRELVQIAPEIGQKEMKVIANQAMKANEKRDRIRRMNAVSSVDQKMDMHEESVKAVDNLLKGTSGPATEKYRQFRDEEFGGIINNFSEDEMKEIEQKAKENTEKREDIPLEKKEQEYEKEKKREFKRVKQERIDTVDDMLKDQILESKSKAEAILGKESANVLQAQLDKIQDKRDKMIIQELIKQDLKANNDYLKRHPEEKDLKASEVTKKRKEEEIRQDVFVAKMQFDAQNNSGSIGSYRGNAKNNRNARNNNVGNNNARRNTYTRKNNMPRSASVEAQMRNAPTMPKPNKLAGGGIG